MPNPPLSRTTTIALALAAAFVACAACRTLSLDFWYDELWSLQHHQLGSLGELLTRYPTPNHHVLANAIGYGWLHLLGIHDLEPLLQRPWLARLPALLCALGAAAYTFAAGRLIAGRAGAVWSLALLLTTMPFFHFAGQVRGYALSAGALAALMFHGLAYGRRGGRGHAAGITVAATAALYAIPANLYAVLAVLAGLAAVAALGPRARRRHGGRAVLLGGLGGLLALALLAPMLGEIAGNRFVQSEGLWRWATLTEIAPQSLAGLLSGRWWLLLLLPVPLLAACVTGRRKPGRAWRRLGSRGALVVTALTVPFALSFVRGDRPFLRVFVPLAPAFALCLGPALAASLGAVPRGAWRRGASAAILVALVGGFALELRQVQQRLRADIAAGVTTQTPSHPYYLGPWRPDALAAAVAGQRRHEAVFLAECDRVAMPTYLKRHGVTAAPAGELAQVLQTRGAAWVISAWPLRAARSLRDALDHVRIERRDDGAGFHAAFRLTRAPGRGAAPKKPRGRGGRPPRSTRVGPLSPPITGPHCHEDHAQGRRLAGRGPPRR